MENRVESWKCLSGNALKMIAIVTMLIDHIGAAIIEMGILGRMGPALTREAWEFWSSFDLALRMVGRMSFPVFCFLLVEGFAHTRDVKKYAVRLCLFAWISEIPFDLAFYGRWLEFSHQNIYATLFLGLAALAGMEKFRDSTWKQALVVLAGCGAGQLLHTDYGGFGVFFILLLYLLRFNPWMRALLGSVSLISIEPWPAVFAFIPIQLYNGKRGRWNFKYIFYAFYPAHLLVLWGIRLWLLG